MSIHLFATPSPYILDLDGLNCPYLQPFMPLRYTISSLQPARQQHLLSRHVPRLDEPIEDCPSVSLSLSREWRGK